MKAGSLSLVINQEWKVRQACAAGGPRVDNLQEQVLLALHASLYYAPEAILVHGHCI